MKRIIQRTNRSGSNVNSRFERGLAIVPIVLLAVLVSACLVSAAQAHQLKERYVLDYNDLEIRGGHNRDAELFLKQRLVQQYPWVDARTLDLRGVTLVAKSKFGGGTARLRVGNRKSLPAEVAGSPRDFHNGRGYTFGKVYFVNPDRDSRGPWQIDLRGNLVVRKVILEVERQAHRPGPKFHGYYGWHDPR